MPAGVSTLAYVYAVTWASSGVPRGAGVGDGELQLVEHGELAAVVSPVGERELRARRRDLLRHAEIVQSAFDRAPVVPLRFGTVVGDVVEDLLVPRRDELVRLLRGLEGRAEVTLRAYYREDDVLRRLLADQPRLAGLRGGSSPLELGEAVAHALAARRDADAGRIVAALRPLARDVALDPLHAELEVVRAAFLVDRDALGKVDAAVDRLAREQAETTVFKYTGPLPPHHFVALEERA